jgi:hypothetical protein
VREIVDDLLKITREIERVERDPELVCDTPGIERIGGATAALMPGPWIDDRKLPRSDRRQCRRRMPHKDPDAVVALFDQQRRRDARIDTATHRDENT